ncbi:DNA-binding MarR family transcriptional regulator [Bradyrhizobium sp. LB11.1]
MAELDDIIHQPLRLKIMAALNSLPATAAGLEFSRLKKLTDGNLGAHIETLAKAGYVSVEKAFVGKKPQATVTATAAGRGAFARHVATLQEIIAGGRGRGRRQDWTVGWVEPLRNPSLLYPRSP